MLKHTTSIAICITTPGIIQLSMWICTFEKIFGAKTIAENMADYFGVTVTGNQGPSMSSPVDFNWKYKEGPVYYKARKGTKTYVR